jgi:beta-galactosidase
MRTAQASLPPIQFDKTGFRTDGNSFTLVSCEFDYFRIPKKSWKKRMESFKDAGGNCLSARIPWQLHEPSEGKTVFGGGDGVHDLEDFLKTAGDEGLYVVARPGPRLGSDLKYGGLPAWLVERFPEIRAANGDGKPFGNASVSCIHPLFLEKAKKWFDSVCPILARHSTAAGGPVAFVQMDDGVADVRGGFGSLDCNPVSMGFGKKEGRYPQFLWRKFGTVDKLNYDYGTQYISFAQVRPPASGGGTDEFELRRRKDYIDFYLETAAEYAGTLAKWIRANGIAAPVVLGSGGPEMNALYLEIVNRMGVKSFLLGSDHCQCLGPDWLQGGSAPRYAVNVFVSLEMLRLMGFPPVALGMPAGSNFDWPPFTAVDAWACCASNLAFGLKGLDYCVFSEGSNSTTTVAKGDEFAFNAPVDAKGEVRLLYDAQKDLSSFIQKRPWFAESGRESDCRFALDFDQARSLHYWKDRGRYAISGPEAWDFLIRGALTSSLCAGLSPAFCDLGSDEWTADVKTPVVVVSSPSMSAAKQMRLVEFLKKGGKILLAPIVLTLDDRFNACDILREFIGKPNVEPIRTDASRVNFESLSNVAADEVFASRTLPAGARVLAVEEFSKKPVAWAMNTEGNGRIVFLGMTWRHAKREQEVMIRTLLKELGLRQKVVCSNPNVWTSWRSAGNKSILFLLNLFASPMETEILCYRENADKPAFKGKFKLNPMEVKCIDMK